MAARSLTPRGLRRVQNVTALPRETQAAGQVASDIMKRAPELARAGNVRDVEAIVAGQWAETMSDLSIVADPHTTIRSQAIYMSAAPGALLFGECNLLAGRALAAGPPVLPAVVTNLLRDGEPIRPFMMHTLGMSIGIAGEVQGDMQLLMALEWELRRDKTIIAEGPLASIVTSVLFTPSAAGLVLLNQANLQLTSNPGGGYELEGHGSLYEKSHNIQFRLLNPMAFQLAAAVAVAKIVTFNLFIDGEVLTQ